VCAPLPPRRPLIGRLTGRPADDEEIRIRTVALGGQFQVFHVCRRMALALLDWDEIDAERQALIKRVVRDHTRALLRAIDGGEAPAFAGRPRAIEAPRPRKYFDR